MPSVVVFTRAATARRQQLLRDLAAHLPGFVFVRFDTGKPGVFYCRIGDSDEIALTLSQVELFVAGLRLGNAHARHELNPEETRRILTHQL